MTFARRPIQVHTNPHRSRNVDASMDLPQWARLGNGRVAYSAAYYSDITVTFFQTSIGRNALTNSVHPELSNVLGPKLPWLRNRQLKIGKVVISELRQLPPSFFCVAPDDHLTDRCAPLSCVSPVFPLRHNPPIWLGTGAFTVSAMRPAHRYQLFLPSVM